MMRRGAFSRHPWALGLKDWPFKAILLSLISAILFFSGEASASSNRAAPIGGTQASSLVKRQFSQQQWDRLVEKGRTLNCQFPMTAAQTAARGTPQSQYTTQQAAFDSGWTHGEHTGMPEDFGIGPAAQLWNLDLRPAQGAYCSWLHSEEYTHPRFGQLDDEQVTMSYYQNSIFPNSGLYIANQNYGPDYMRIQMGLTVDEAPTPPMWRFSDFAYVQWDEVCRASTNCQPIQYFLRHHVVYPPSFDVARQALRGKNYATIPTWANRAVFTPDDEDDGFFAILAGAHGSGAAYFLLQHKAQLGLRRISEITVWAVGSGHSTMSPIITNSGAADRDPSLMIMLHVEAVEN